LEKQQSKVRRRAERRREAPANPLLQAIVTSIIAGFSLVALGVWFLVDQFWFNLPGIDRLWPVILMIVGAAQLIGYLFSGLRRYQYVVSALTCSGLGIFFLFFSLEMVSWDAMSYLWPAFPLITGVAQVAGWVASFGRRMKLLTGGLITSLVGVIGFAFTLTFAGIGPLAGAAAVPILLILAGVGIVGVQLVRVVAGVLPRVVSKIV
jgi:hypothetical protein